jgi:hypothetical protein
VVDLDAIRQRAELTEGDHDLHVMALRADVTTLVDELEMARGVLAMWELVASHEEVTTVQRLAAVRALHKPGQSVTTEYCEGCSKRGEDGVWLRLVNYPCPTLRALDDESAKDGACCPPGRHCSQCIESDPDYQKHAEHRTPADGCPYCSESTKDGA